jgi:hypothetical protein
MVCKEVFLVKEGGGKLWLEQKTNGSLWQDREEIFATEAEARNRGWKVDAVKVRWESAGGNKTNQ